MTELPDHRPGMVTLACKCGSILTLPPEAADAARLPWTKLHTTSHCGPTDAAGAAQSEARGIAERFVAVAEEQRS